MIPRTQSTRLSGQYCATVDRQFSTLRAPPESAGHCGDHCDELDPLVVVVVLGAFVVVVLGAFVVVVVAVGS
jgi:hypothetical protein